ncbi:hypothetical protein E4U42_002645 [Claviceps africana]|uniref:Holocytochrome c-type synthase n=1 Tax=Claviceps africana TaxID=83212 RepID=A0A8K0J8H6_9HYPO|nr:hypothetical protein E4U42_002645 [Claviceps africana]
MADKDPPACPVDSKTRDAWLAQARAAEAAASCPVNHDSSASVPKTWTQSLASYLWSSSSSSPAASPAPPAATPLEALDTNRVISTIPRSAPASPPCPVDTPGTPTAANHEIESGMDPSGKWVYPSEKMFFDAMKRKGYDARVADMKTVVPIHNAVNERAWQQIVEWETPYLSQSGCQGPKLESFANKNDRMTPTARINTILGYTAPFDRHDWVIDRCGTRIDYVIDFYAGRPAHDKGRPGPSFYLHVRPKLNTWEGIKMRLMRFTGLI